jgi:hypothetical protein
MEISDVVTVFSLHRAVLAAETATGALQMAMLSAAAALEQGAPLGY